MPSSQSVAAPDSTTTPPFLSIEALDLHWPNGVLFAGVEWRVPAGVALVQGGPASGKTTLLRLLAGAVAPTRGRMLLGGLAVRPTDVFWAERDAAQVDQAVVRAWWGQLAARFPAWDEEALARHVAGFALAAHQDKPFFMLSTGSRRKAWLAAALASGAPMTLIDEPLAGLDLESARYFSRVLAELAKEQSNAKSRVIVVAYDEPLEAVPWCAQWRLPDVL